MEKVASLDGTRIAFHHSGEGPALVLVHGSGGSNPAVGWTDVVPALEKRFSVYAIDRRGRGGSGDGTPYALAREYEDIAAVVDSIGEPAHVMGHSSGANCALESALLTQSIRKLVLYEPQIPVPNAQLYPDGVLDRIQSLLETGDREVVLITYYREVVGMSPAEIEQLRASPAWQARLETVHTLVREERALERYVFDARRFAELDIPTLLLLGGDSPAAVKAATEAVGAAMPNSRIAVMPGQEHLAMYTAPELFVREMVQFLSGPS